MAWNDVYAAPVNQPTPDSSPEPRVSLPPVYAPTDPSYPAMTPDPAARQAPKILDTSYSRLPTDANPGGSLWDAAARVGTEMNQTYQNTPDILPPPARQAVGNMGWLGRYILGPAADVGSFAVKEGSALGAGGLAALSEIASGGDPKLARDVHAALQILPVAQSGMPPVTGPIVPRSPSFTGDMPPMARPPSAPAGPVSPSYQPEAVPIKTPADALKVSSSLYKAADASDFQLKPQFTQDWVDSLDQYQKQTPAGQAAAGPNATTDLITSLRKTADAPIDSIQSIQEVDKTIQDAVSNQYKDGTLSPEGKQMRQILQDFRQRYSSVPPDQMSGSPQGIQAFNNARGAYAAYSRMNDLQGVVDSTQGNPNRATLIASRTNAFLNDPDNVRGWTSDEVATARKAADSGFLQEWMRAEGSRLVGIGTAVMPSMLAKIAGVPVQVGLSYGLRNAAENMRVARLQDAIGVLGQRVPQPGTVPPRPPPFVPPQAAVSAARYAPLVGLLGQPNGQQQPNQ